MAIAGRRSDKPRSTYRYRTSSGDDSCTIDPWRSANRGNLPPWPVYRCWPSTVQYDMTPATIILHRNLKKTLRSHIQTNNRTVIASDGQNHNHHWYLNRYLNTFWRFNLRCNSNRIIIRFDRIESNRIIIQLFNWIIVKSRQIAYLLTDSKHSHVTVSIIRMGALFYSPVDFTDASDLNTLMQVWCIGEINRWIKQRTLCDAMQ